MSEVIQCSTCIHRDEQKIKGKCFPENELQFFYCDYHKDCQKNDKLVVKKSLTTELFGISEQLKGDKK